MEGVGKDSLVGIGGERVRPNGEQPVSPPVSGASIKKAAAEKWFPLVFRKKSQPADVVASR